MACIPGEEISPPSPLLVGWPLRAEPPGTVVLADGFSCRTQIEQLAGRPALHLAELLRDALDPRGQRVP